MRSLSEVSDFLGQEMLIIPSHPGIFSEHVEKQVSHRNKVDRDTDRDGERGENLRWKKVACNLGDFPWLPSPLFFTHTHTHANRWTLWALFTAKAVITKTLKVKERKTQPKWKITFSSCPSSDHLQRAVGEWVSFIGGDDRNRWTVSVLLLTYDPWRFYTSTGPPILRLYSAEPKATW